MAGWKPAGYPSLSAYLVASDAEGALQFMLDCFGGKLLRRIERPEGGLMHAEVQIDDSVVMLGAARAPGEFTELYLHLYVADVEKTYRRALKLGAEALQEPMRKHVDDDLRCGVRDPYGTTWWIATQ